MALAERSRLGPYEILAPLGAGGMGEVYRARDTRLDRDVAVKVLPPDRACDPARLRLFEHEARAVAALDHPHILAVHDVGREAGVSYVVFEYLAGRTLRRRLEEGPLPPRKAVEWAVQLCRGLAAAHARGIVHRDLKPENVFVTAEGQVKILDFGLAALGGAAAAEGTAHEALPASTASGAVAGTVGYVSPEQVRGLPADARSDIFVVGAIVYEMLSGRRAFPGQSAAETWAAILHREVPEVVTPDGALAPGLDRVLRRCLEKDPEERFQSARDLAFALEALSGTSRSGPELPRGAPARSRAVRRAALLAALVATVAGSLLAGRALWWRPVPEVTQLTFENGIVEEARFAPDGRTVVYSALWDGRPSEVFQMRLEDLEPRPLGLVHARLLAVSSSAELAILQGQPGDTGWVGVGTLARVPLSGGVPRPLLEGVSSADWSPDGRELAVVRWESSRRPPRLEYPIGTVLVRELPTAIPVAMIPRVSPRGDRVALTVAARQVLVVDKAGRQQRFETPRTTHGIAWDRDGDALWLSAGADAPTGVWRLSLDGRLTHVYQGLGGLFLHDVSPARRMLVHHGHQHLGVRVKAPGEAAERELPTVGDGAPVDLSPDGTQILTREGSRNPAGYLHATTGGPGTRLLTDMSRMFGLSPDGRWLLASSASEPGGLLLVPTGAGDSRRVPTERFERVLGARFEADGRVLAYAGERERAPRGWLLAPSGREWIAITPEGVRPIWVRPGQGHAIGVSEAGAVGRYPLDGGAAQPLDWAFPAEHFDVDHATADGRFGFVWKRGVPGLVDRIDLDSGERIPWRRLRPEDATGVGFVGPVVVRAEVDAYAYFYGRFLHHLSIIDGLR